MLAIHQAFILVTLQLETQFLFEILMISTTISTQIRGLSVFFCVFKAVTIDL